MFSLDALLNRQTSSLEIDEVYNYNEEYIAKTDIKKLENVSCKGKFFYDASSKIHVFLKVEGIMILEDAISLEEVEYPFSFEMDEDLEENWINLQNSIDIMEFLWQNIVLEVPLGYTTVTDFSKYCGDGWKLVGEEQEAKPNLPFADLLK